ncbi:MAG: peptide deformylase [Acidimicrobiales bacterium]
MPGGTMTPVSGYSIRLYGDPVLRQRTNDVTEIDGNLKQLADDMIETMYAAPGVGLAANQVGIQKRMFVYDAGEGPKVVVNPRITESSGEWSYDEGCLSVPKLYWPITRPRQILLEGLDLDGNEISVEAEEYLARVYQHEVDHLDGVLLIERLDPDQRKEAMRTLRQMTFDPRAVALNEKLEQRSLEPGGPEAGPKL